MGATASVFERITRFLQDQEVEFRHLSHGPVRTSEEAAAIRGEPLKIGGKALVVKMDNTFCLFVLSATLRFDSKAARAHLGARRSRFATPEELAELTGLVPGSVPPFGPPMLSLPLHVDESITTNNRIAFNAGSLSDFLVVQVSDYLRVAHPEIGRFT